MRDIFEITEPEPVETALFMHSFYDVDDAASFVDSYRTRILEGMDHDTALAEITSLYGLGLEELTFLLSKDQL